MIMSANLSQESVIPYKLQSLGADGVEGGSGENADIKHSYLPYFDHINQL